VTASRATIAITGGTGFVGSALIDLAVAEGHEVRALARKPQPSRTGVTWVAGELWHGTWEGDESDLRRVDPQTGEVLERLEMPTGMGVSGLESDGCDRFFCGGGRSGKVRAVRRPKRRSA